MSKAARSLIVCFLPMAVLAGGCDRGSSGPVQANAAAGVDTDADAAVANAAEPLVSADEAAPGGPAADAGAVRPDFGHAGEPAPTTAFADGAGKPVTLAAFRGKPLLVNLWATWCAPCVAELPTLDALAKREAGALTVVAISQDLDPAKAADFWAKRDLPSLALYTDPELKLSVTYSATLPTTVLYDSAGREIVRVTGGMDWAGPEAAALIAKAR